MATTHLGLVVYGCVVAAILRSQGIASAPIEGEVANVKANQNGDLEQQLMQQSGENKSSQPSSSSVNHGAAAVDPADPQGQDSSLVDEVDGDGGDDVEATGLSSDYYGEATQLERLNEELREEEDDGIKDIPAAAAAAGPAEEEDRNSNGQLLQDEETNNGRNKEGYNINFQERSFENDAEKIENEENKNRAFRIEDDVEQMERPWEDVNDFEGQEAPPSGEAAAAAENKEMRKDDDGDVAHENGRDNESTDQPKEEKEKEKEEGEGEGEGERTRIDRQNIEQLRYAEDGQRNTAETFDSRLLISREKKTLQGKWRAAESDKPDMQRDGESRLGYVDDGSFNEEEVYM